MPRGPRWWRRRGGCPIFTTRSRDWRGIRPDFADFVRKRLIRGRGGKCSAIKYILCLRRLRRSATVPPCSSDAPAPMASTALSVSCDQNVSEIRCGNAPCSIPGRHLDVVQSRRPMLCRRIDELLAGRMPRPPMSPPALEAHARRIIAAAQRRERTDHRHPVQVSERRVAPTRVHNSFKYMKNPFHVGSSGTLGGTRHESNHS